MAQTGYTPLLIYSSSTVSQAPAAGNLTNSTLGSELAINITDGKLFYKDNANAVQVIAWKTTPTTAGGTGLTSYTAGDLLYYATGTTLTKLAIGATGRWLGSSGTAPQWNAPAALTKTDDTNVTLTLGGSASTALLNAASITVGWTGTLATTRGGTGLSSFTANGILYASSTSALATSANLNYTSGNLGLNATPAAWSWPDTSTGVLQLQAYAALSGYNATTYLSNNWYYNAGEKFIANGYATRYEQTTGKHVWYVSNASNAGGAGAAVTWTQVMQTHASTGVSIGNTTDPGATNLSVSGNGLFGTTTASARLTTQSSTTTSGSEAFWATNGTTRLFSVRGDGLIYTGTAAASPYNNSVATAANMVVTSTGEVQRSTSSLKYKKNVQNATHGLADVLKLRAVTYQGSSERDTEQVLGGLIAEEVDAAGLSEFVQYADDGTPDALAYGNMVSLAFKAIQELAAQNEQLKQRITALESK